jgi:hypothetical protein
MTKTLEVEIDETGKVRPTDPAISLPHGRALLIWQTEPSHETMLLSEASLSEDWLKPEEDKAWAYMQPDR